MGPQFIAKDFKEFIRIAGMTHVRTSSYYPQSNGKIERRHKSIKHECIQPKVPLSLEGGRNQIANYIRHYKRRAAPQLSELCLLPPRLNWTVAINKYSRNVTANSKQHEKQERKNGGGKNTSRPNTNEPRKRKLSTH